MEYIEVTGKSVDEAITNACLKLETSSDKIEYEVIAYSEYLIQSQQRLRQELSLVLIL